MSEKTQESLKKETEQKTDWILILLKGMIVGTGAILPGVSGGVLCLAFGIYEPLIEVLSNPGKNLKKHRNLFLPFSIGWLGGFFLLAKLLEVLFLKYETVATVFFAGLIVGTMPAILKEAEIKTKGIYRFVFWTLLFLSVFRFIDTSQGIEIRANIFWYLVSGSIWGLSMIIPGLSSSSLLIVMGLYQKITAAIANLDLTVIVPVLIGLLAAILTLSKLVKHLYDRYRHFISAFIGGIMIASVIVMLWKLTYQVSYLLLYILLFILGYFISGKLDG
ncbi:MAG: DUF368 domain-containing protein [Erysipelotrichaceae bacterium]|nr:DUF368 domain-containing protein [Erysipelotrichaceae bacterium]